MKILIVGSTSAVGRSVGRVLSQAHTISYAGRRDADYHLDLVSPEFSLPDSLRIDVVIHVAADFGGDKEEDIIRAETTNAMGTLNICRLARQCHAEHVIVMSSAFAGYMPGAAYSNAYALSKRHGDELATLYCQQFSMPLTILRPSQIYDAESRCKRHQNLFYLIVERAQAGDDIVFYGGNDALRNYIFIDDVAEIVRRIVEKKVVGSFYCSARRSIRLGRIAQTAYRVFKTHGRVVFDADKPPIRDLKFMSGNDLYKTIDFYPSISLAEGINRIRLCRQLP